MAYDKVIDSAVLDADLTAVADAIRAKGGTSEALSFPGGFVSAVEGIQAGGGDNEIIGKIVDGTITEINDSNATYLRHRGFQDCKQLEKVSLPNVISASTYCFYACSKLKDVNLPKLGTLPERLLSSCSELERFDTVAGAIQSYALHGSAKFKYLILRKEGTICTLGHATCVGGTFFDYGVTTTYGLCLVPSALISQYQAATNWSVLYNAGTCVFLALEDYTLDGTITGEIDWAKVEKRFEEA
jgi:hypothetical protein